MMCSSTGAEVAVTALRLWALSHRELRDVGMEGLWTLGLPGACKWFFLGTLGEAALV